MIRFCLGQVWFGGCTRMGMGSIWSMYLLYFVYIANHDNNVYMRNVS